MSRLLRIISLTAGLCALQAHATDSIPAVSARHPVQVRAADTAGNGFALQVAMHAPAATTAFAPRQERASVPAPVSPSAGRAAAAEPSVWGVLVLVFGLLMHQLLRRPRSRNSWDLR